MALILRNGGSQSPDRWLKEPRNNHYIQKQPIGLVKKEFDIVELLSQNAGQVFDKERIYERVWGYDSEGDSSVVAEHIRRIRTKIAAYTNKSYIETVWGCGYKWIR